MNKELTVADEAYLEQMNSWLKEQQAREGQIRVTIKTSAEITRQNQIQLEWHMKAYEDALNEFEEWKESKSIL